VRLLRRMRRWAVHRQLEMMGGKVGRRLEARPVLVAHVRLGEKVLLLLHVRLPLRLLRLLPMLLMLLMLLLLLPQQALQELGRLAWKPGCGRHHVWHPQLRLLLLLMLLPWSRWRGKANTWHSRAAWPIAGAELRSGTERRLRR